MVLQVKAEAPCAARSAFWGSKYAACWAVVEAEEGEEEEARTAPWVVETATALVLETAAEVLVETIGAADLALVVGTDSALVVGTATDEVSLWLTALAEEWGLAVNVGGEVAIAEEERGSCEAVEL